MGLLGLEHPGKVLSSSIFGVFIIRRFLVAVLKTACELAEVPPSTRMVTAAQSSLRPPRDPRTPTESAPRSSDGPSERQGGLSVLVKSVGR